jgi:hypothetical protein
MAKGVAKQIQELMVAQHGFQPLQQYLMTLSLPLPLILSHRIGLELEFGCNASRK